MIRNCINLYTCEFGLSIIPKYIQLSLANFPEFTRLESLVQSMILIVDVLPARNKDLAPIALYCVKKQAERAKHLKSGKLSTKLFILSLFRLISVCDNSILVPSLEIIEEFILSSTKENEQRNLCLNLKYVITKNYDATRKNICVNWYLNLIHLLHFDEEVIVSSQPNTLHTPIGKSSKL